MSSARLLVLSRPLSKTRDSFVLRKIFPCFLQCDLQFRNCIWLRMQLSKKLRASLPRHMISAGGWNLEIRGHYFFWIIRGMVGGVGVSLVFYNHTSETLIGTLCKAAMSKNFGVGKSATVFLACRHAMHEERDTVTANPSVCLSITLWYYIETYRARSFHPLIGAWT